MKNQYFGDTRDLFKYDLVMTIAKRLHFKNLLLIPMLTRNDNGKEGNRTSFLRAKAGLKNVELMRFLLNCLTKNRRNIQELEHLFGNSASSKEIDFSIYRKNQYFSNELRKEYFQSIDGDKLKETIVLLDPDIGFEAKNMTNNKEKYLLYGEAQELFYRMDESSILVVFQFIPRVDRAAYLAKRTNEVKERVTRGLASVYFITDNQVIFFVLAKNAGLGQILGKKLSRYASANGLEFGKA